MFNFNDYNNEKNKLLQKINAVENKMQELCDIGIDVSESISKIARAKEIVENEKISIVLVGAFSDGKTSVAAGWINEKLDNMKIASDESSDEILCYTPTTIPEGCQIVDTPGLFGDKLATDDFGEQILLSEMTKKYISEANLILYVVNAKNPIKDSHKECVKWIVKDLNKLSSIIFVINRMDDVADLTDEDDFSMQAKIKTDNLRGKLLECGLSQNEAEQVKVACISAAPNGQGIDIWNEHRDEYLRRSHLGTLESMTNSILQNSRQELITKTGCDILNDELNKTIDFIFEQERQISKDYLPELKESLKRNRKDLEALHKRLVRSKKDMKDALKALNKKKISVIRSASMDSFKDVLEDEIGILPGKEGHILNDEINEVFSEYADKYESWTIELGERFQTEYEKQNKMMESLLKKGAFGAANGLKSAGHLGVDAIKGGIFAGRNVLGKLGVVIKFKPWQVTKMATFATKALPLMGAGIDLATNIIENVTVQERNKRFEKRKSELKDGINETFYELMEMLNSDDKYIEQFAPGYKLLEEQIRQDEEDIRKQEDILRKFNKWNKEIIDADYIVL